MLLIDLLMFSNYLLSALIIQLLKVINLRRPQLIEENNKIFEFKLKYQINKTYLLKVACII